MNKDEITDVMRAPGSVYGGGGFPSTRESLVLLLEKETSGERAEAVGKIYQAYWRPLWAFIKARRFDQVEGQDVLQEFFLTLIRSDALSHFETRKARFRSYLLGALRHFIANYRRGQKTKKAGGDFKILAIEGLTELQMESVAYIERESADVAFDRAWAMTLIEAVRNRIRNHYKDKGKLALFEALEPCLPGSESKLSYDELAREFGVQPVSIRATASRMRRQFGVFLRELVAQTVIDENDIEDELRHLMSSFVAEF